MRCSSHISLFPTPRTSPVEAQENFRVARIGEFGPLATQKGSNRNDGHGLHRSCCNLGNILLDDGRPNYFSYPATYKPRAASARKLFCFAGTGREAAPGS